MKKSDPSDPTNRGERLKRVRNLANMERSDLCAESDINAHTLKGWEVGRHGGLTKKGAEKIITTVAKHGVICSLEWLLYEIGAGPKVYTDYEKIDTFAKETSAKKISNKDEIAEIAKELSVFKKFYQHTMDLIVEDDGMLPHYQIGDYIAGVKKTGADIASLVGHNCIVQTKEGRLLFRELRKGNKPNSFTLFCLNTSATIAEPVIYDLELASAARVVWQRKLATSHLSN